MKDLYWSIQVVCLQLKETILIQCPLVKQTKCSYDMLTFSPTHILVLVVEIKVRALVEHQLRSAAEIKEQALERQLHSAAVIKVQEGRLRSVLEEGEKLFKN